MKPAVPRLELFAITGLPLIEPGVDLIATIIHALDEAGEILRAGDIVIIAQKIVSKSENRYVVPKPRAHWPKKSKKTLALWN